MPSARIPHARAGRVRWRTGLLFGAAGMAGAYGGGRLAAFVPPAVLLAGFAVMMLATATAMLRGRHDGPGRQRRELPVARVLLDGVVVGLVTGLVGAGGGFLVVPALALLGGLPMPVAVGTSLVVIAMKSFAGLAGYLSTVTSTRAWPPPSPPRPCSAAWPAADWPDASARTCCAGRSAGSWRRWACSSWPGNCPHTCGRTPCCGPSPW